jgi:hypothetical protein
MARTSAGERSISMDVSMTVILKGCVVVVVVMVM